MVVGVKNQSVNYHLQGDQKCFVVFLLSPHYTAKRAILPEITRFAVLFWVISLGHIWGQCQWKYRYIVLASNILTERSFFIKRSEWYFLVVEVFRWRCVVWLLHHSEISIGVVVVVVRDALSNVFGDFENIALLEIIELANVTTSVPVIAALTFAQD